MTVVIYSDYGRTFFVDSDEHADDLIFFVASNIGPAAARRKPEDILEVGSDPTSTHPVLSPRALSLLLCSLSHAHVTCLHIHLSVASRECGCGCWVPGVSTRVDHPAVALHFWTDVQLGTVCMSQPLDAAGMSPFVYPVCVGHLSLRPLIAGSSLLLSARQSPVWSRAGCSQSVLYCTALHC
jgi:hypothetical protein